MLLFVFCPHCSAVQRFWVLAICYEDAIIMIKYFFQLPLFCVCRSLTGNSYELESFCQEQGALCQVPESSQPVMYQPDVILGISNQGGHFLEHIIFNVLVLLALLLHRSSMMYQVGVFTICPLSPSPLLPMAGR